MTNHQIPHPADVIERTRRKVRDHPEDFANDLADQHFAEALDMLMENAREDMTFVIFDDLRMSLPPDHMERLHKAYQDRIGCWLKITPANLDGEDA